jgi:hypothetical protein
MTERDQRQGCCMAKTIEGQAQGAEPGESAMSDDVGKPAAPSAPQADPRARSGGMVSAAGKRHRPPPPSMHGVKHSDQRISRMKAAMIRGRRGNRG